MYDTPGFTSFNDTELDELKRYCERGVQCGEDLRGLSRGQSLANHRFALGAPPQNVHAFVWVTCRDPPYVCWWTLHAPSLTRDDDSTRCFASFAPRS